MVTLPNGERLEPHAGGFRHIARDGKTTLAWYPTFPKNLRFKRR